MKIIFIIFFIIDICYVISGQYLINDKIPSYLYYKFNNIKEKIFPFDIRINISLSRIDGDLLYSIDKNMNQLIVSLSDEIESVFKIEFRNKEYNVSFFKLCGCVKCLYEIFDLRIQIREQIALQCNNREIEYFKYSDNKEVNEIYPVLYSKNDKSDGLQNEAHMWLVNQEHFKNTHHNPFQMLGCIFNVLYNKKEIHFTKISDKVGRNCTKTCVGDICNGGKCYESYNHEPVCDCTFTYLSGTYCKENIKSINRRFVSSFNFDLLKVSWKSSSNELLILKNSNLEIQLRVVDKILYLNSNYTKGHEIFIKGIISNRYIPKQEYILIIHFLRSMIHIQCLTNGNWSHISIPTIIDLTKEIFTSSSIQSGDGYIDLSYKISPREYIWHKVNIEKYEEISNEPSQKKISNENIIQTKIENEKVIITKVQGILKKEKIEFISLMVLILLSLYVLNKFKGSCLKRIISLMNGIKDKLWNRRKQHEKIPHEDNSKV